MGCVQDLAASLEARGAFKIVAASLEAWGAFMVIAVSLEGISQISSSIEWSNQLAATCQIKDLYCNCQFFRQRKSNEVKMFLQTNF